MSVGEDDRELHDCLAVVEPLTTLAVSRFQRTAAGGGGSAQFARWRQKGARSVAWSPAWIMEVPGAWLTMIRRGVGEERKEQGVGIELSVPGLSGNPVAPRHLKTRE